MAETKPLVDVDVVAGVVSEAIPLSSKAFSNNFSTRVVEDSNKVDLLGLGFFLPVISRYCLRFPSPQILQ